MTRTSQLAAAGLALAAALPALAFAPAPERAPKQEKITFTFVEAGGKKASIGLMNPDGSQRTVLSKGDVLEVDPALSPDGKRIAFVTVNKGDKTSDVWVMNADGSGRKKLTESPVPGMALAPCWSPDGKHIAYSRMSMDKGPAPETEVFVMGADGKDVRTLAKGLLPAWSPDGKKLLYSVIDPAGDHEPRLYVMDSDGGNARQLLKGVGLMAAWSPDGKRIAYVGSEKGTIAQTHVYVCKADGSEPVQLTRSGEGELAPHWSADSRRVYFTRMDLRGPRHDKAGIFVIDADGANEKQLTKDDGPYLLPGAGLFVILGSGGGGP